MDELQDVASALLSLSRPICVGANNFGMEDSDTSEVEQRGSSSDSNTNTIANTTNSAPSGPPRHKHEGLILADNPKKRKQHDYSQISFETLRGFFTMPLRDVAKSLGMCATALKKVCRANGVHEWPYRQLKSIDLALTSLEAKPVYTADQMHKKLLQMEDLKRKRQRLFERGNCRDNDEGLLHFSNCSSARVSEPFPTEMGSFHQEIDVRGSSVVSKVALPGAYLDSESHAPPRKRKASHLPLAVPETSHGQLLNKLVEYSTNRAILEHFVPPPNTARASLAAAECESSWIQTTSHVHETQTQISEDAKAENPRLNVAKGRKSKHFSTVTFEQLRAFFKTPLVDVAKELGVCTTVFKKICRFNGIYQWPYRHIKNIEASLTTLEDPYFQCTLAEDDARRNFLQIEMLKKQRQQWLEAGKCEEDEKATASEISQYISYVDECNSRRAASSTEADMAAVGFLSAKLEAHKSNFSNAKGVELAFFLNEIRRRTC